MPREPETVEDFLWQALFNAAEKIHPKQGRDIVGTMKHRKQMHPMAVYDALRAAEKADVPHQYLWACVKGKTANVGWKKRPTPAWCVSEDHEFYYGRNGEKVSKAVKV